MAATGGEWQKKENMVMSVDIGKRVSNDRSKTCCVLALFLEEIC